jgi:hypothetical protein
MRRCMLALVMLCLLRGMLQAAQVQHNIGTATPQDALGVAYTSNIAANSLLKACCAVYQGTFGATNATFSDTKGNTWSVAFNIGVDDANFNKARLYMGYALNTNGAGPDTVTCNPPGTSDYITLVIVEESGMAQASVLDQTATASNGTTSSSAVSSGTTGTTAQADEVLTACMLYDAPSNTTITETAPLVLVRESEEQVATQSIAVGDRTLSSTGTYSAAWTLGAGANWAAGVATFRMTVVQPSPAGLVVPFP